MERSCKVLQYSEKFFLKILKNEFLIRKMYFQKNVTGWVTCVLWLHFFTQLVGKYVIGKVLRSTTFWNLSLLFERMQFQKMTNFRYVTSFFFSRSKLNIHHWKGFAKHCKIVKIFLGNFEKWVLKSKKKYFHKMSQDVTLAFCDFELPCSKLDDAWLKRSCEELRDKEYFFREMSFKNYLKECPT